MHKLMAVCPLNKYYLEFSHGEVFDGIEYKGGTYYCCHVYATDESSAQQILMREFNSGGLGIMIKTLKLEGPSDTIPLLHGLTKIF